MSGKYVFTQGLKELRFLFCQTSEASAATRSFLNRAYPTMKKHNPQTPIMIREAAGTQPRVYARYAFGKEKQEALSGLSDVQIEERITHIANFAQSDRCPAPTPLGERPDPLRQIFRRSTTSNVNEQQMLETRMSRSCIWSFQNVSDGLCPFGARSRYAPSSRLA
ncbi:hypothetical protein PDIDSM_4423 [Penicillium digitatum]|nr:hypothetical protein PDIDSM_4423 [Penicillium digitatum]